MKSDSATHSENTPAAVNLTAQPLASATPTSEELEALKKSNRFVNFVIVKDATGTWRFHRIKTKVDKMQNNRTVWHLEPANLEEDANISPEIAQIQDILANASTDDLLNSNSTVNAKIQALISAYTTQNKRRTLVQEVFDTESSFLKSTREFVAKVDKLPKQEDINVFMEQYRALADVDFLGEAAAVKPAASTIDEFVLLKAHALINTFVAEQADGTFVMTDAFKNRLKILTGSVIMYENFNKVFGEDSGNDISENDKAALQAYAIMPTQRVTRYDLLSQEVVKQLEEIPAETPQLQALKQKTIAKFKSISEFTLQANEIKRHIESLQKLLTTQVILGKMAHKGLVSLNVIRNFGTAQVKIWENFLAQIAKISESIIKDNIYFTATEDSKITQARDKFYEAFMNTFIEAYLLRQDRNTDLASIMLQYIKSIDRKLQREGLAGIFINSSFFSFLPTSAKIFETLKSADPAVVNRVVNHMAEFVKKLQQNAATDPAQNNLYITAYSNAETALKAMGPTAAALWNKQINKAKEPPIVRRESVLEENAESISPGEIDPVWLQGELFSVVNQDILGKIAEELKAKRVTAAKYGFAQLQIWDTFAKDIQGISRNIIETNALIDPEKFYETFMRTFIAGYIVHAKSQRDVFSECIRPFIVTVDKYFQQLGIRGVVYQTIENLPGPSNKDLPALQTLKNNPALQTQIVEELFRNLKSLVESTSHGDYEVRVFERTLKAVTSMGERAVMLWNLLADKEFFELSIPCTKEYDNLLQLGNNEMARREGLVSLVKIELIALVESNHKLAPHESIPEEVLNEIGGLLREALINSKSRSDLNENIKLAMLKLFTYGYLQGRLEGWVSSQTQGLKLIDQFIERVEKRLADNKQRGMFVERPKDLKPFTWLGTYTLAESVFAKTRELSPANFQHYLKTLFADVKKLMSKPGADQEKIFVNTVKLLERTGVAAKEKWNELAARDPDPKGKQLSLNDALIEWSGKKALLLYQGQIEAFQTGKMKELKKLLADEIKKRGDVPPSTTRTLFMSHVPIAAYESPPSKLRQAPPLPLEKPRTPSPSRAVPALPTTPPSKEKLKKREPTLPLAEKPDTPLPPLPQKEPPRVKVVVNPEPKRPSVKRFILTTPPPMPTSRPDTTFAKSRVKSKSEPPPMPKTPPPASPPLKGKKKS